MAWVIGPRRLVLHLFIGLVILATLLFPISLLHAEAASRTIDPREIALTLDDLPIGFTVDAGATGVSILPDSVGVVYRVDMKRPSIPEAVQSGPIVVQQIVVRLDSTVTAAEMLASVRDEIVRDAGLKPTNDGPNDGGTVTLKRQDDNVTLYSVGFAKDQMVIFTTTGGLTSVTTFPRLVELAGISSAKLDAALAR